MNDILIAAKRGDVNRLIDLRGEIDELDNNQIIHLQNIINNYHPDLVENNNDNLNFGRLYYLRYKIRNGCDEGLGSFEDLGLYS